MKYHQSNTFLSYTVRLFSMCLCMALVTACAADSEEKTDLNQGIVPEVRPEMIFDVADSDAVVYTIETQGVVRPSKELLIQMRVGGYLETHGVYDGARVQKDQILIKLQDPEFELSVTEAESNLDKAIRAYEVERRSRQTSGVEISDLQDRLLRNQYGVTTAELALERANMNKSYATFKAPFDGAIQTQNILTPEMNVSPGVEYGLLLDQSIVNVRLEVLAVEINRIRTGMAVEIDAPSGERMNCSVESVSPVINELTKTGQVSARCSNSNGLLKRGMNVNARIKVQSIQGTVRVPRAAVLDRDQRKVVFRLKGDRVEWIYVQPIAMNSEWAVLDTDNVVPGDTIAVDRHFTASHDLRVTPKMRFGLQQQVGDQ